MTYDRPYQAIRVLEEGYARGGPNRTKIALSLLGVYDTLSDKLNIKIPQTDFINSLYADRATFTPTEWQSILEKINALQSRQSSQEEATDNPPAPAPAADTAKAPEGLKYDENGDLIFKQC